MKKKKYTICQEVYKSQEWHERTKKGWGSYIWLSNGEVIMFKPREDGINGTDIRQPNLLQITRRNEGTT